MQRSPQGFNYRHVLVLLIVAWAVRFLVVWAWPGAARSADSFSWEWVTKTLLNGQNPYKETPALNWPPFWMLMLYLIAKATISLKVLFSYGVQFFLAAVESLVVVALFRLIRQLVPTAKPFMLLLLGIALNPVTILLVCQHCNFDVIVALWVLLFVGALARYYQSHDDVDWLLACLFLGLGILTKTVPLVLCPMLAGGFRRVAAKARWLGLMLVFGPVTLGMSIIYVLAPADVTAKVIGYRPGSGWFGITGLLHLAGADGLAWLTNALFYAVLAGAGALTAMIFWKRERIEGREIVMYAAMFLAGTPALGPGYGSQYLYWIWPLLLVSYLLYGRTWRKVLWVFMVVTTLTCLVEYALFPSHGQFLFLMMNFQGVPQSTIDSLMWWISKPGQATIRLPLFFAFLTLLTFGIRLLVQGPRAETATPEAADGKRAAR